MPVKKLSFETVLYFVMGPNLWAKHMINYQLSAYPQLL
jgi:hypothetical protein